MRNWKRIFLYTAIPVLVGCLVPSAYADDGKSKPAKKSGPAAAQDNTAPKKQGKNEPPQDIKGPGPKPPKGGPMGVGPHSGPKGPGGPMGKGPHPGPPGAGLGNPPGMPSHGPGGPHAHSPRPDLGQDLDTDPEAVAARKVRREAMKARHQQSILARKRALEQNPAHEKAVKSAEARKGAIAAEQRKHIRRMIELQRVMTVSLEMGDGALTEKMRVLYKKERARHEKFMQAHGDRAKTK